VTSPSPRGRSRLLLALLALVGLLALSACAVGRPQAFTARSNSFCSDALRTITSLKTPSTPLTQIQYATDRYTALERAVSELTDSSLPGGGRGGELRDQWLRPARSSLKQGRQPLLALKNAVHADDASAAATAFRAARIVGTAGVNTSLLRSNGLVTCATLFTPTAPA
jgi:hypothetical protein